MPCSVTWTEIKRVLGRQRSEQRQHGRQHSLLCPDRPSPRATHIRHPVKMPGDTPMEEAATVAAAPAPAQAAEALESAVAAVAGAQPDADMDAQQPTAVSSSRVASSELAAAHAWARLRPPPSVTASHACLWLQSKPLSMCAANLPPLPPPAGAQGGSGRRRAGGRWAAAGGPKAGAGARVQPQQEAQGGPVHGLCGPRLSGAVNPLLPPSHCHHGQLCRRRCRTRCTKLCTPHTSFAQRAAFSCTLLLCVGHAAQPGGQDD